MFISCSSNKEVIQGYSGHMLKKATQAVRGKSPAEVRKILGRPAVEGLCKSCERYGVYRMIYLTQDMRKFYLELSYNTDQEIDCLVADFYPTPDKKDFVFDWSKGLKLEHLCNQKTGVILQLREML
jgi:hypothetical protein